MAGKIKKLLYFGVVIIGLAFGLLWIYGFGYGMFGPNGGRIESKKFIDSPGEIAFARGEDFNMPLAERPCHVPKIEVVPFKVLSLNPPRFLYSCNTYWLDNVLITILELINRN